MMNRQSQVKQKLKETQSYQSNGDSHGDHESQNELQNKSNYERDNNRIIDRIRRNSTSQLDNMTVNQQVHDYVDKQQLNEKQKSQKLKFEEQSTLYQLEQGQHQQDEFSSSNPFSEKQHDCNANNEMLNEKQIQGQEIYLQIPHEKDKEDKGDDKNNSCLYNTFFRHQWEQISLECFSKNKQQSDEKESKDSSSKGGKREKELINNNSNSKQTDNEIEDQYEEKQVEENQLQQILPYDIIGISLDSLGQTSKSNNTINLFERDQQVQNKNGSNILESESIGRWEVFHNKNQFNLDQMLILNPNEFLESIILPNIEGDQFSFSDPQLIFKIFPISTSESESVNENLLTSQEKDKNMLQKVSIEINEHGMLEDYPFQLIGFQEKQIQVADKEKNKPNESVGNFSDCDNHKGSNSYLFSQDKQKIEYFDDEKGTKSHLKQNEHLDLQEKKSESIEQYNDSQRNMGTGRSIKIDGYLVNNHEEVNLDMTEMVVKQKNESQEDFKFFNGQIDEIPNKEAESDKADDGYSFSQQFQVNSMSNHNKIINVDQINPNEISFSQQNKHFLSNKAIINITGSGEVEEKEKEKQIESCNQEQLENEQLKVLNNDNNHNYTQQTKQTGSELINMSKENIRTLLDDNNNNLNKFQQNNSQSGNSTSKNDYLARRFSEILNSLKGLYENQQKQLEFDEKDNYICKEEQFVLQLTKMKENINLIRENHALLVQHIEQQFSKEGKLNLTLKLSNSTGKVKEKDIGTCSNHQSTNNCEKQPQNLQKYSSSHENEENTKKKIESEGVFFQIANNIANINLESIFQSKKSNRKKNLIKLQKIPESPFQQNIEIQNQQVKYLNDNPPQNLCRKYSSKIYQSENDSSTYKISQDDFIKQNQPSSMNLFSMHFQRIHEWKKIKYLQEYKHYWKTNSKKEFQISNAAVTDNEQLYKKQEILLTDRENNQNHTQAENNSQLPSNSINSDQFTLSVNNFGHDHRQPKNQQNRQLLYSRYLFSNAPKLFPVVSRKQAPEDYRQKYSKKLISLEKQITEGTNHQLQGSVVVENKSFEYLKQTQYQYDQKQLSQQQQSQEEARSKKQFKRNSVIGLLEDFQTAEEVMEPRTHEPNENVFTFTKDRAITESNFNYSINKFQDNFISKNKVNNTFISRKTY